MATRRTDKALWKEGGTRRLRAKKELYTKPQEEKKTFKQTKWKQKLVGTGPARRQTASLGGGGGGQGLRGAAAAAICRLLSSLSNGHFSARHKNSTFK